MPLLWIAIGWIVVGLCFACRARAFNVGWRPVIGVILCWPLVWAVFYFIDLEREVRLYSAKMAKGRR